MYLKNNINLLVSAEMVEVNLVKSDGQNSFHQHGYDKSIKAKD